MHTEAVQIFLRKINASHRVVAADIADDVGELKREAQTLSQIGRFGIVKAENMQASEADGSGNAIAIFRQAIERRVSSDRQIHFRAENQIVKVARGDFEARDGVRQRRKNCVAAGAARDGFIEQRAPASEALALRIPGCRGSSETLSTSRMKA